MTTARDTPWLAHHRARWTRGDARIHFGTDVVKALGLQPKKVPPASAGVSDRYSSESAYEAEASELKFQIAALRLQRAFAKWLLVQKAGFQ